MRDYPAIIQFSDGSGIRTKIRSGSLCAAIHQVQIIYGWKGIEHFTVYPAPLY